MNLEVDNFGQTLDGDRLNFAGVSILEKYEDAQNVSKFYEHDLEGKHLKNLFGQSGPAWENEKSNAVVLEQTDKLTTKAVNANDEEKEYQRRENCLRKTKIISIGGLVILAVILTIILSVVLTKNRN